MSDADDALSPERAAELIEWFERGIPFNVMLGLRVDAFTRGRAVLRLPWQDALVGDVARPSLHGGVTSMLADTAGGAACFAMLDRPTDRVSTVDLRVDYLRPGAGEDVVCRAEVLRMGNRVGVTRMEVFVGETNVATGHGVYNILRRD